MRKLTFGDIPVLDYASTEAINTLATNVTFAGSQYKTIMLTSCTPNEGKSYVAFNLVRALANMGYTSLLLDADLRKSVFMSRYDVQIAGQRTGLTHYLAGRCNLSGALYQSNVANMFVLPAGKDVVNSLPLLTSPAFVELLGELKKNFDFIIVDAPPVGIVIDAAMIASACDATVFVVSGEQISKHDLVAAVQQIEKSGCTLLGAVLNRAAISTHKGRKYYSRYTYSHYGKPYGPYGRDQQTGARNERTQVRGAESRQAKPQAASASVAPPTPAAPHAPFEP